MNSKLNPVTDPHVLRSEAYCDERHLLARQQFYRWKQPYHNIPAVVVDLIKDRVGLALDVGCGNGTILRETRKSCPKLLTVGMDLSSGMLRGLSKPVLVGDAMQMPFSDNSASVILAMHMLFHLRDIAVGLGEFTRVLRIDGS